MSKALFFNALPDESSATGYDRNYNADDLSDFLSIVCDTGVVKTNNDASGKPQGLKVSTPSGRTVNVNAGKAVIRGKAFINEETASFTVEANGTASTRYDYVVVRYDNNVSARNISLELVKGTNTQPTAVADTERVKELLLAVVAIAPSGSTVTVADKRGDAKLCPWFTAVKGYEDYYDAMVQRHESTVAYSTNPVVTTLASNLYNAKYSLVEVYTNGIKELESAFTASASGGYITIAFASAKAVGAKITVVLSNFIDGEGMSTALAQYNALLQDVAELKTAGELNYICNGVNDNVLISNLVKAFYSVNDYKRLKINVIGNVGISTPVVGTGTSANPYGWFDFTKQVTTNRVATVDFSNAGAITPTIANGTVSAIFRAEEINIIGASVIVSNTETNTTVKVFSSTSGRIYAENCRFWLTCYADSLIAHTGTFVNCRGSVTNVVSNSYCYLTASSGMVRIYNGEYYAYTGDANAKSAVVGQSGAEAVTIMYGVSAPTTARGGFYQTNAIYQVSGGGMISCTDLISALPLNVVSGANNTRGTIAKSKAGLM